MSTKEKLAAYLSVLRFDHWIKNLFFLPGLVFALYLSGGSLSSALVGTATVAFVALGLVASVNYTINEIIDAPFDRFHPTKQHRAIPSNKVRLPVLYGLIILLLSGALFLGYWWLPRLFVAALGAFFISGLIYNLPPVRLKDVAVLDVLTESINNPIRFAAGWFIVSPSLPPLVYLITFWALGAFWMAGKRYGEFKYFSNQAETLARYRRSFRAYSERRLAALLIGSAGVFLIGYTFIVGWLVPALLITWPFVAIYFGWYGMMILRQHPLVREPEGLIKHPWFMAYNILLGLMFSYIFFG